MKKTVCVDLDGVIDQYSGWKGFNEIGDPIEGAREFLINLKKKYRVVIFTTRGSIKINKQELLLRFGENVTESEMRMYLRRLIKEYMDKHRLSFSEIYVGHGKPPAIAYVDDRAVLCVPQKEMDRTCCSAHTYTYALDAIAELANGKKEKVDVEAGSS